MKDQLEVEPLEFPTVDPDDQQITEVQFAKSASRSAGSKKAWETRRKKAAAAPEPAPDAAVLRSAIQRVYEKREEVTAVMAELAHMEAELDRLINRVAGK